MVEQAALVISDHYLVIRKSTEVLPIHPGQLRLVKDSRTLCYPLQGKLRLELLCAEQFLQSVAPGSFQYIADAASCKKPCESSVRNKWME